MGQALSIKDSIRTTPATPFAKKTPDERASEVKTNATKAWVDQQTGAVYDDPASCTQGCYQLQGEEAVDALKSGTVDVSKRSGLPPTPEAQTRAEIRRLAKADEDAKKAAAEAEAERVAEAERQAEDDEASAVDEQNAKQATPAPGSKAAPPSSNKARKNRPSTKRR